VQGARFDRLILHNARVRSLDDAGTLSRAIGFSAGRVTAVGSLDQVRRATPAAEERDLGGCSVYPGFIDTHHHFCFAASYADMPQLRMHRDAGQILATVAAQVERTPAGQWIVMLGWDETRLDANRAPTRFELDEVAPEHPVLLIHFSYHQGVLNSRGLEAAGLLEPGSDPPGGLRGRTRSGELDGAVLERCFGRAEDIARRARTAQDREGWFATANGYQDRVLAAGITHVCDAAVPPEMESLYREWQLRGELRLGVTMMPLTGNIFAVPSERLTGTRTGWREDRLSVGPMKLFLDGGRLCAVCHSLRDAILEFSASIGRLLRGRPSLPWLLSSGLPLRWRSDLKLHAGLLFYAADAIDEMVGRASAQGFGVGIHAAGNEAIELAIRALGRSYRGELPPRIDHFFLTTEQMLRDAAREGIHAVVQPSLLLEQGEVMLEVGAPPHLDFFAFRQLQEAGIHVAGSSDAPCADFDVLRAIDFTVRRELASGATLSVEEALSVSEAVEMYTRGAARVLGMDGEIGQLVPGSRADAVVLSDDLLELSPGRLRDIEVLATFAGRYELPKHPG
jgi:predicted amidohydrolase YtcJ